ncbi:hypothetical protein BN1708_019757, partial [Verticillium longisporum]
RHQALPHLHPRAPRRPDEQAAQAQDGRLQAAQARLPAQGRQEPARQRPRLGRGARVGVRRQPARLSAHAHQERRLVGVEPHLCRRRRAPALRHGRVELYPHARPQGAGDKVCAAR